MYIFAYICLLLALLASLGGSGMALLQLWEGRANHVNLIKNANWLVSLCLLLASAMLLHALFWEDYRLEYVASYTDSILPIFYRLTAFWAGQPGSLLFWALITALCGSLFAFFYRPEAEVALWFWALFYGLLAFFCLLLACWSNPFIMQAPAPPDGNGLNPLLQNPGMIFHPPLLFMGYAGFTIPACLGMAQLLANTRPDWFSQTRPFWLISWILLTAGIILGAWWAYMELGWGGYWAWDPVENASLLPWLFGTAAIHIIVIASRLDKLNRAAVALMALTVVSTFFATYLTRSGVIQSVHAFGDGGVGTPLTVFIVISLIAFLWICFSSPTSGKELGNLASREGALVLTTWIFLALAAIIATATMWPVISKINGSTALGLDAAFYNRVCLPLGFLLLLILCACLWLGWQRLLRERWRFWFTCGICIAAAICIWMIGFRKPLALVSAAAAIGAACAMLLKLSERSAWLDRSTLSALGAHFGIAIAAIGIAFSGPYTNEKDMLLLANQSESLGPYTITLEKIQEGARPGYDYLQAVLRIDENHKKIGQLKPERRIYAKFGDMQFSEVDVISGLGSDIYSSLLGMDEDHRILVKVSLEPLVNWIWLGGALMCLLPLAGLGRIRKRSHNGD